MRKKLGNPSFAVVGAGIIGAAVAGEISRKIPHAEITVYEKDSSVAAQQTGHNSGVVHAGLYYEPGSLKARLCRRGVELLKDFALTRNIPYEECGKLVVALRDEEIPRLEAIYEKAKANGVPGVELIGPDRIYEIEPNAVGRLALHSPGTAIIDFAAVTRALLDDVKSAGGTVQLDTEVQSITNSASGCIIHTDRGSESFDYLIVCAGLQSDRIAKMVGGRKYPVIVPFFGQYSKLEPQYRNVLNGLVYPVPDPAYPFLGVHLTKRVDGEMLIGPNAFLSFGRENYSGFNIGFNDSFQVIRDPGFWKFAAKNMKAALRESMSVVSKKRFIRDATAYVPSIEDARTQTLPRGIRAQAMDSDGSLVDDFVIENIERATLIRNAPSPGATSSLAIAEHIVAELLAVHNISPAE